MCQAPSTDGGSRAWVWALHSEGTRSFLSASHCRRGMSAASGARLAFPEVTDCTWLYRDQPFSTELLLSGFFFLLPLFVFLLLISATATTTKKKLNHDPVISCVDHLGHSIHWVTQVLKCWHRCPVQMKTPRTLISPLSSAGKKKLILKNCFCEGMHLHGCICVGACGSQKRVTGYYIWALGIKLGSSAKEARIFNRCTDFPVGV